MKVNFVCNHCDKAMSVDMFSQQQFGDEPLCHGPMVRGLPIAEFSDGSKPQQKGSDLDSILKAAMIREGSKLKE